MNREPVLILDMLGSYFERVQWSSQVPSIKMVRNYVRSEGVYYCSVGWRNVICYFKAAVSGLFVVFSCFIDVFSCICFFE